MRFRITNNKQEVYAALEKIERERRASTESVDTAESSYIEETGHDYEPGDVRHPMHTNPLCRICGQAKRAQVHR